MISNPILMIFLLYTLGRQVKGYEQELCLHETESHNGNYQCFREGVPDSTSYALGKIKSICLKGLWLFYNGTNYTSYEHSRSGSNKDDGLSCSFLRNPMDTVSSFRFMGPKDVDHWKDTIVLYTGKYWVGRAYTITSPSFGDIQEPILSIASTGQANWTLFEGSHFDGKSVCWESPVSLSSREPNQTPPPGAENGETTATPTSTHNKHFHFTYSVMETNNMQTVGSVTKGCVEPKPQ